MKNKKINFNKNVIIDHVNKDHYEQLISIYKTHINKKYKNLKLVDFDKNCLYINIDNNKKKWKIPYPSSLKSLDLENFKKTFIQMYHKSQIGFDAKKVQQHLIEFINEHNSILLATMIKNEPVISCAPLLHYKNKLYIYISEIAEHYSALKQNPNKIRCMIIEDETIAPSPINRKRVNYKCIAKFVTDKKEINAVFNNFIKKNGRGGGVGIIRDMQDFHLIELKLQTGRFYMGFGQAYNILPNGKIVILNSNKNSTKNTLHKYKSHK